MQRAKLYVVLLALVLGGYGLPGRGFAYEYDHTQTTNFGARMPGDTVGFTVTPPNNAQGKAAIVTKGNCDNPGGYSWKGGPATWWSTITPDYPSSHSGRFSGEYGYPGTGVTSRALTWQVNTAGKVVKVTFGHLSSAPQGGIPATRFENNVASGPIAIEGIVNVTPQDQTDKVSLRLAHNVKTLRQRALGSTINMFQISTGGAWVKDGDSTMNTIVSTPGVIVIRGADEPALGYWTEGPFSHPLHIVENHKNFLQYLLPSSGEWITIGVVQWGWTADVYKDGETITTSGAIEGDMGHESNETPIASPRIQDIPETSISPID